MYHLAGGAVLGFSLGANDAANVFGPGVSSGTVRFRVAVLLTALFVIIGAVLEGPGCMKTIGSLGRTDAAAAFSATTAAGLTMIALTLLALPASASQATVGALIGVGLVAGSARFEPLIKVVVCWVATPVAAAVVAFALYHGIGYLFNRFLKGVRTFEVTIRYGIILSGCYGAYALGANNVSNTTGPFVTAGLLSPPTAALLGGSFIGLGAIAFSRPVMQTVGARITALGPLGALIAILSMSLTVHAFTFLGVPVSTSQAIVGAVTGIGMVRGSGGVNRRILGLVVCGWLATPVAACAIAAGISVGMDLALKAAGGQ